MKSENDWEEFLAHCEEPLKDRVAKESIAEMGISNVNGDRSSAQVSQL